MFSRLIRFFEQSESGLTGVGMAAAAATAMALSSVALSATDTAIPEAEANACRYELRVLQTAVEADHASDEAGDYAAAAGVDGFEEVRAAGWLATEAGYWRYLGPVDDGRPAYEQTQDIDDCE